MGILNYFFPPLANVAIEYNRGLPVEEIKPTKVCSMYYVPNISHFDMNLLL